MLPWFFKADERLPAVLAAVRALGVEDAGLGRARDLDQLARMIARLSEPERRLAERLDQELAEARLENSRLLASAETTVRSGNDGVLYTLLRARRVEQFLNERRRFVHARENALARAAEAIERVRLGATLERASPREALGDALEVEKLRSEMLARVEPEWISIPANAWLLGARPGDPDARPDERPQAFVSLSAFEITREPQGLGSWNGVSDASLPTELEWEVAVRYFGLEPAGLEWCRDEWEPALYVRAAHGTDPVGRGRPEWRVARGPRLTERTRLSQDQAVSFRLVRRSVERRDT